MRVLEGIDDMLGEQVAREDFGDQNVRALVEMLTDPELVGGCGMDSDRIGITVVGDDLARH